MRIFLVGFMGSGKTRIGKVMAQHLGYAFVDMDQQLEARFGMTVSEIFAELGETAFREAEREWIDNLAQSEQLVISTGGGTPCYGDTMEKMNKLGKTVYLQVSDLGLYTRLSEPRRKAKRPLIADLPDKELKAYVCNTLALRAPFYQKAHITVNGMLPVEEVVPEIMRKLFV